MCVYIPVVFCWFVDFSFAILPCFLFLCFQRPIKWKQKQLGYWMRIVILRVSINNCSSRRISCSVPMKHIEWDPSLKTSCWVLIMLQMWFTWVCLLLISIFFIITNHCAICYRGASFNVVCQAISYPPVIPWLTQACNSSCEFLTLQFN